MRERTRELAGTLVFPLAGLALIAGIILLGGKSPAQGFAALISGSLGGAFALAETAIRACPLLLAGLGVTVAFRAGVWNIGAEGQIYIGALAVVALAPALGMLPAPLSVPAALLVAAAAGGVWAWVPAFLRTRRGVQEVISTIMLNFIAIQLVSWCVHGPLKESTGQFPYSNEIPAALTLPRLLPPTRLHLGVVFALAAAVVVWVFLFRTLRGFQLRAVGASPEAALHAGIRTERSVWSAMAISGALAGIAGAVQLMGVSHILFEKFSPGYGYTAIAAALLGGLHPVGVTLSAGLLGALEAGASAMQREAGVSTVIVYLVQGVIILSVAHQAARRRAVTEAIRQRGAQEV
ncbi:MAG: ABC transporter permease [Armatimonadota bacterium]